MSYRELRNFTETMRALGYRRLISVENFRTPNFELVADILYWLVTRYDPHCDISDNIDTEEDRVEFLKSVAQIMLSKARVKLSIKQLYRADGYAVKELLKVSNLLYQASRTKKAVESEVVDVRLGEKLEQLKQSRSDATIIVESGSALYSLLAKEEELRASRTQALRFVDSMSRNLESNDQHQQIERNIREQINILTDNIANLEQMTGELSKDHKALSSKIDRRDTELERAEKRFKSLKKVKPAFMGQYEKLEAELRELHEVYIEKFRNLHYLESELEKYHKADKEKREEVERALKKMQRRLRAEELAVLRGEQTLNSDAEGFDESVYDSGNDDSGDNRVSSHQRGRSGGRSAGRSGGRARPPPPRRDEDSDSSSFMDDVESLNEDEFSEDDDDDDDDDDGDDRGQSISESDDSDGLF